MEMRELTETATERPRERGKRGESLKVVRVKEDVLNITRKWEEMPW